MRYLTLCILFCFLQGHAYSQKDSTWRGQTLARKTIDPDSYSIVLGAFDGRWNNKVGGEYDINLLNRNKVAVWASLGGFINMHDFFREQSLSWQLWRGNLGINGHIQLQDPQVLGKNGRFIGIVSWVHESQHATDVYTYTNYFTNIPIEQFDNGGIRSFEYYKFKGAYIWEPENRAWLLSASGAYKHFPTPKLKNTEQMLLSAWLFELGVEKSIYKGSYLYANYYREVMQNAFVASERDFKGSWNRQPFNFNIFEGGIGYLNAKGKLLNLYISYSDSNGRGLDFPEVSQRYGVGMRITL